MSIELLMEAFAGRFDRWRWSAGLTPAVVGVALGQRIELGPVGHGGRDRLQTVVRASAQPFPVRLRWESDEELAMVEFTEPVADPSWVAVLQSLGRPEKEFAHGRGPVPGGDQLCYLSRGLTVFDSGGLGYQAVWLYPSMTAEQYPERTGAFEAIRRPR